MEARADDPWVMYYVVRSGVPFSLERAMPRTHRERFEAWKDAGHTQVAPGTETVIALVPSSRGSRRR
jgi:hypothetical protein